ncbi:hypothetical protein PG997_007006 [Apiospora hydei]|uniref:Uncharacterized protein n=1 Tax=Apiospora hydei TaxID=1337664 RepID=A0ABR1WQB8_9PEZI
MSHRYIINATNTSPEEYTRACERLLQDYVELPRSSSGLAAVIDPSSLEATIALLHFHRTVQHSVSTITDTQFLQLRKLSREGRRRPRQLRHQLLVLLELRGRLPHEAAVRRGFLDLFLPWEKEQLVRVHNILGRLCAPGLVMPRQPMGKHVAHLYKLGSLKKSSNRPSRSSQRTGGRRTYLPFFDMLRGGPLPQRLRKMRGPGAPPMDMAWNPVRLGVAEEHRGGGLGLVEAQLRRERERPRLVYDEDADARGDDGAPPFAWVDAHDGLHCQRWGTQLRYGLLASGGGGGGDGGGQIDVEPRFTRSQVTCFRGMESWWCHLGFLFWDRERVEQFQRKRLPVFETGWLTAMPPPSRADELLGQFKKVFGYV